MLIAAHGEALGAWFRGANAGDDRHALDRAGTVNGDVDGQRKAGFEAGKAAVTHHVAQPVGLVGGEQGVRLGQQGHASDAGRGRLAAVHTAIGNGVDEVGDLQVLLGIVGFHVHAVRRFAHLNAHGGRRVTALDADAERHLLAAVGHARNGVVEGAGHVELGQQAQQVVFGQGEVHAARPPWSFAFAGTQHQAGRHRRRR